MQLKWKRKPPVQIGNEFPSDSSVGVDRWHLAVAEKLGMFYFPWGAVSNPCFCASACFVCLPPVVFSMFLVRVPGLCCGVGFCMFLEDCCVSLASERVQLILRCQCCCFGWLLYFKVAGNPFAFLCLHPHLPSFEPIASCLSCVAGLFITHRFSLLSLCVISVAVTFKFLTSFFLSFWLSAELDINF